jgi:hypothetical protein
MRRTFLTIGLLSLALGGPSSAQDLTFNAEPGVAFWVDQPQSDRFTPAFTLALRPGVSLTRSLDAQISYSLVYADLGEGYDEAGSGQSVMGGLRYHPFVAWRPIANRTQGLFVDGNLGWVRTGGLDRLGFDAGLGYNVEVSERFTLGPVIRYAQIVQEDDVPGVNPNDAQFLGIALDFGFSTAPDAEVYSEMPVNYPPLWPPTTPPEVIVVKDPLSCTDTDSDGVCDAEDRCPSEVGPVAALGCPIDPCSGKPLIVLVQFEYDSDAMPARIAGKPQTMDPILDAVADAIAQDPSCRVCIVGNASEEGPDSYNRALSLRRAEAVQSYLIDRGLTESRMPTIGLGSSCPIVPETSRLLNRRVEFRRLQEGESCSTVCVE